MVSIGWCKGKEKGISLGEQNNNLSKEYLQSAEETLIELKESKESNMWKATKKYYFEYFLAYSFLMKVGIKCEIHDCTIELCKFLEKQGLFLGGFAKKLEEDKELRIDNQYYLKNIKVQIDYQELLSLFLDFKNFLSSLTNEKIIEIREAVEKC